MPGLPTFLPEFFGGSGGGGGGGGGGVEGLAPPTEAAMVLYNTEAVMKIYTSEAVEMPHPTEADITLYDSGATFYHG